MLFDNKVVHILTTHLTNDTTAPNTGRASLDIFIEYQWLDYFTMDVHFFWYRQIV